MSAQRRTSAFISAVWTGLSNSPDAHRAGEIALRGKRGGGQQHVQMWITRPYASSTASCMVSLTVGCGKTVCMSSASVLSSVRAMP